MQQVNLGYKLIALAAVFSAVYSCSSSSNSQSERSTAAQLAALRDSIDALNGHIAGLDAQIASLGADVGELAGCSTESFLADQCGGELPDDAAITTTYCIAQGRGVQLGAAFGLEMNYELDVGAGWPNVLWGKGTAKATGPLVLAVPPFVLPTEVGGEASTELGRGLEICVDVPIVPTQDQKDLIGDLVAGVNLQSGIQARYHRRANRLLNYAALRTPIASVNLAVAGALTSNAVITNAAEEADDSFDIADNAIERFMANEFQPQARVTELLADPIFADLASALDLPAQLRSVIEDPQQALAGFQPMTTANACATLGLDAALRGRFPALDGMCTRLANLPDDGMLQDLGTRVTAIQSRVLNIWTSSQLGAFICSNVTLAVFAPGC